MNKLNLYKKLTAYMDSNFYYTQGEETFKNNKKSIENNGMDTITELLINLDSKKI